MVRSPAVRSIFERNGLRGALRCPAAMTGPLSTVALTCLLGSWQSDAGTAETKPCVSACSTSGMPSNRSIRLSIDTAAGGAAQLAEDAKASGHPAPSRSSASFRGARSATAAGPGGRSRGAAGGPPESRPADVTHATSVFASPCRAGRPVPFRGPFSVGNPFQGGGVRARCTRSAWSDGQRRLGRHNAAPSVVQPDAEQDLAK